MLYFKDHGKKQEILSRILKQVLGLVMYIPWWQHLSTSLGVISIEWANSKAQLQLEQTQAESCSNCIRRSAGCRANLILSNAGADSNYWLIWSVLGRCDDIEQKKEVSEPVLWCKRKAPAQLDVYSSAGHFLDTPKQHYHQQYFECLVLVVILYSQ